MTTELLIPYSAGCWLFIYLFHDIRVRFYGRDSLISYFLFIIGHFIYLHTCAHWICIVFTHTHTAFTEQKYPRFLQTNANRTGQYTKKRYSDVKRNSIVLCLKRFNTWFERTNKLALLHCKRHGLMDRVFGILFFALQFKHFVDAKSKLTAHADFLCELSIFRWNFACIAGAYEKWAAIYVYVTVIVSYNSKHCVV